MPGLLALTLAAQMLFAGYVSTVAFDAASEAATIAATADGGYWAGKQRAQAVLAGLIGGENSKVSASKQPLGDGSVWRFRVLVTNPFLGFGGVTVSQQAEALSER